MRITSRKARGDCTCRITDFPALVRLTPAQPVLRVTAGIRIMIVLTGCFADIAQANLRSTPDVPGRLVAADFERT